MVQVQWLRPLHYTQAIQPIMWQEGASEYSTECSGGGSCWLCSLLITQAVIGQAGFCSLVPFLVIGLLGLVL